MESTNLRVRSKRAYERGRLRLGLMAALPVVPMVMISMYVCRRPELAISVGVILFAVGLTLQAGATGAVKTVKMSAKLVSGRAPADPTPE